MGVDAWIGSVMPLIQKGVSFETIKSLGAQGVYDMHRDAVADGQIYGPSPKYAGNFMGQYIGQNKPPMMVRFQSSCIMQFVFRTTSTFHHNFGLQKILQMNPPMQVHQQQPLDRSISPDSATHVETAEYSKIAKHSATLPTKIIQVLLHLCHPHFANVYGI